MKIINILREFCNILNLNKLRQLYLALVESVISHGVFERVCQNQILIVFLINNERFSTKTFDMLRQLCTVSFNMLK